MLTIKPLARTIAPLVDLVYPPRCPLCGEALAAQMGLCLACWSLLEFETGPASDRALAAVRYNDAARRMVLAFKSGGRIALAPVLARLMAARMAEAGWTGEGWLAVPVPLHRWRLWQRGFNQSALLAQALARHTGAQVLVDGLHRHRRTPSLGGLGREERHRVLAGAIRPRSAARAVLTGRNVLLVDDVLTSGATTGACLAALGEAGAGEIRICCFARVEKPG